MKKILLLALFVLLPITLNSVDASDTITRYDREFTQIMDTRIAASIWVKDENYDAAYFNEFERIFRHIYHIADRHKSYDGVTNIKTINDNPGIDHTVDTHLFEMIKTSIEYHDITLGLFDITLGPVLSIWSEYRENCNNNIACELPSSQELEAANAFVNIENITLNEDTMTVRIEEGMSLDLGGIAKGYASKVAGEYLATLPIESYLVNAGESNIEVLGAHPSRENKLWYVGLIDPNNTNPFQPDRFGSVYLSDGQSAVTSGDYQRLFVVDGKEYHHIINPNTLIPGGLHESEDPAKHFRTVTVVHDDPYLADIYSTALFLMDLDTAYTFVESQEDLTAVFYTRNDKVYYTSGFLGRINDVEIDATEGNYTPEGGIDLTPETPASDDSVLPLIIISGGFLIMIGGAALSKKLMAK